MIERTLIEEGELEVARCYMLYRARKLLLGGKVDPSILQDYIFHSKYGKPGETWDDCVGRVKEMHIRKFPQFSEEIRRAFRMVREKKVLPSMRSLQFGGPAIEANAARMYNCSFTNCDRNSVFKDIFWLLLSGCGVGYSVQDVSAIDEFPELTNGVFHLRVEDTIEGWAWAVECLINYAHAGIYLELSYDAIRPEGAELKTSGGKAPGHIPLKGAIEKIRPLLVGKLSKMAVHRIICFLAEAVVSGGIRRSSLICLFGPEDEELMNCKTGDWYSEMPELAMANNSVVTDKPTRAMFTAMEKWGEPGIVNLPPGWGTNPCGEIGLHPDPRTVAFCNLTSIVGQPTAESIWAATFIGTLQATYIPEFVQVSDVGLLGVSVGGIMDEPIDWDGCREEVRRVNAEWAPRFGIVVTDRLTCVKPEGTSSLLVSRSAGIHPAHAKRSIRRIIAQPSETVAQEFKAANPWAVEVMPDGNWSLMFPVEAKGVVRDDLSAVELMEAALEVQDKWVTAPHNVSCTITVRDDEWDAVYERWEGRGMAFLPWTVEYPFSPWSVNDAVWRDLVARMVRVKYTGGMEDAGVACEGGSCEVLR